MTSVASFYIFRELDGLDALRDEMEAACAARDLKGTVLLAPEGVNAVLAGAQSAIEEVVARFFPEADVKWSSAAPGQQVFGRLKVRVKDEILTFGKALSPSDPIGRHVEPGDWDALLDDPAVLVIDTRNDYESALGTFRGARRADTATFGEFRDFARRELDPTCDQRIALFCTGGIRCEKASAYLIEQGFTDVCQLKGGILGYFANADRKDAFKGHCFVFDERGHVSAEQVTVDRYASRTPAHYLTTELPSGCSSRARSV